MMNNFSEVIRFIGTSHTTHTGLAEYLLHDNYIKKDLPEGFTLIQVENSDVYHLYSFEYGEAVAILKPELTKVRDTSTNEHTVRFHVL